jgi:predicted nucleotidyltransferase
MLDTVLLGKTRAALLRELFLNPDRRLSFNELVRRVQSGDGAVARELRTLIDGGLVAERREGNQRLLSARRDSPVFDELRSFLSKTSGAPSVLREALAGFAAQIDVAFIFGSVARGRERAESDLDLFVIGRAGYSELTEQLRGLEERLGRRLQLLYFDPSSAQDRASLRKSSMKAILTGPKIFVLGDEARLAAVVGSRSAKKTPRR